MVMQEVAVSLHYTLLFYKNVVFPAQAEYSYFFADFRLKIFLYYSYITFYYISVLEFIGGVNYKFLVFRFVWRYIVPVLHRFSLQSARSKYKCHFKRH